MRPRYLLLSAALSAALPAMLPGPALAETGPFFYGLEAVGGVARGRSNTTNGGGLPPLFGADGIVESVRFGTVFGIGGHVGYRFDSTWSAVVSYRHVRGDVGWTAYYPSFGLSSAFDGDARSHAIIGSIVRDQPLSETSVMTLRAGLGVSFNRLSGIVETDPLTGDFISNLASHTRASPAAEIGLGFRHSLTPNATLGLDASVAYAGRFRTGDTRSGNLGVTPINPYTISNVWRGTLGASLNFTF